MKDHVTLTFTYNQYVSSLWTSSVCFLQMLEWLGNLKFQSQGNVLNQILDNTMQCFKFDNKVSNF